MATTLMVGACSKSVALHPIGSTGDKLYAVSSEGAAFYRHGPQQGNGPDTTLPRDTIVKLIRPSFGYSKVQVVETKQQGYISSDDIRVAPPALVASASATPSPVAAASTPPGEQFSLDANDPRLQSPADQLPAADDRFEPDSTPPLPQED
ncbi:MAG: hypothetical protein ACJ8KU_03765 [Chthoniobacterales bacterium]